jgi:hypothetical protein
MQRRQILPPLDVTGLGSARVEGERAGVLRFALCPGLRALAAQGHRPSTDHRIRVPRSSCRVKQGPCSVAIDSEAVVTLVERPRELDSRVNVAGFDRGLTQKGRRGRGVLPEYTPHCSYPPNTSLPLVLTSRK